MLQRTLHTSRLMHIRPVFVFLVMATLLLSYSTPGYATPSASNPVIVPLSSYANNQGIGSAPGQANFGGGYSYPASQLPSGQINLVGVPYQFPANPSGNDNVVALGQNIPVTQGNYLQASLLVSSAYGPASGTITINYADGSSDVATLTAPDWYAGGTGVITTTARYTPTTTETHPVSIFALQIPLNQSKVTSSITLPVSAAATTTKPSMHIFALTLRSTVPAYAIQVLSAQSTTKIMTGTTSTQIVQATVQNVGTQWFTAANPVILNVVAAGVTTVQQGLITDLGAGEEAVVEIGIQHISAVADGTNEAGTITAQVTGGSNVSFPLTLTVGVPAYTATDASLTQHQAPDWYDNAKFGIFINWGIYSVPAWAPTNAQGASTEYSEWYWKDMNNPSDPTYQHELQTYGQNFNYDDFIPQFTTTNFDPKAWVQLFQQAGAKYFVLDTKHHDGFSLFQDAYSNRNSVALGPHEDIVKALFDAAQTYAPDMKRGAYYSLPEWYNPSYPGGITNFPGGPPKNPYTGQVVPYTGYIPVANYVQDYQKPQMLELVNNYKPDLLWCDIGGVNDSNTVFTDYFNNSLASGQQVAVNNRCGNAAHDFTTPEYKTYSNLTIPKWESNRGIDPFSFGYNAATALSAYATTDQLISDLVDIVSKNGNLLLNIGPEADGSIPTIMQQRLQDIGAWLKTNGESIYNTTYWWRTPQDGNLRFTISPNNAFYITSLVQPGSQIVTNQPVPIQPGDKITMLGYNGGPLQWSQQNGQLIINVPTAAQQAGQHAWVFKIAWH